MNTQPACIAIVNLVRLYLLIRESNLASGKTRNKHGNAILTLARNKFDKIS